MHSIPIPHGLLPSRARYASECEAKVLIVFYPTKRSYKISACNLTIRTKTAIFSLQNDYYASFFYATNNPNNVISTPKTPYQNKKLINQTTSERLNLNNP